MKKLAISLLICLSFTGVAFASPLTDYSQGKVSVDINWRPSLSMENAYGAQGDGFNGTWSGQKGKSSNLDWGITVGLGNNFAIQYNQFNPETKYDSNIESSYGMNTQELNLLYQLNKNISAFVGYNRAKYTSTWALERSNKNTFQAGLIGSTPIADKTTLYGVLNGGSNLLNYEAGVSYEVTKDLEFNLSYRYKKVEDLDSGFGNWEDVSAKGIGYGLTFKF